MIFCLVPSELKIKEYFDSLSELQIRWVSRIILIKFIPYRGWSGGAMMLGKLSVPGLPTYLE